MKPTAQLRHINVLASSGPDISVRSIISALGENSFALLLMVFALLNIALTPVPGQSMVISVPMTILAWQWLRGRRAVTLPARMAAQTLPSDKVKSGLTRALPLLLWLEKYCQARAPELLTPTLRQMSRITLLLLCMALFIPIPLTHILPDIAILMICLGELEDDGAMLAFGTATGLLALCAFVVIGMLIVGGLV